MRVFNINNDYALQRSCRQISALKPIYFYPENKDTHYDCSRQKPTHTYDATVL